MRFLPLLITVFIDSLGFGLAFPIFSALAMSPEHSILPADMSLGMRGWIFGLLISSFCVGQFFGGPILGALSDRMGRKKILLLTILLGLAAYAMTGIGIVLENVWVILAARTIGGWAAANWSIAQSIVVDRSSEEEKAKNFGLLGMAWGTGFIIGPFLGGKLSDPEFFFGGNLATPFWVAGGLCLLNYIVLVWCLEESLPTNLMAKIRWTAGFEHLKKAFSTPKLRGIFFVMFTFSLGWGFFTEFFPVFLTHRLGFKLGEVANFFAWVGLWMAICQGLLIRPFLKRFTPQTLLPGALIGMLLVLPLMLLVQEAWVLFAILPFLAFFESIVCPTTSTLVSNLSSKEAQGEMLGMFNSIQWAAIGFTPLFSGSIVALFPHLPITAAMATILAALGIYLKVFKQTNSAIKNNLL